MTFILACDVILSLVHGACGVILATFGLHRLILLRRHWALSRAPRQARPCPPVEWPSVTIQLPVFNERYVIARLVASIGALEYPASKLDVQILDDSTDDTPAAVASAAESLRRRGIAVDHVRRASRHGFKAGALQAGLRHARGELIAVFDADFVPPSDFLLRLVPEFSDPSVAMVQARWVHLNGNASLLTRIQALQLDAHFVIEQTGRAHGGYFFNFNGTAGVWRASVIEALGGWNVASLTEDLDLSYRAQLAGWRFVYRPDVSVPGELPSEVAAYRLQQQRWAHGAIETAKDIIPRILRAPLPRHLKSEAMYHLLQHVPSFLLLACAVTGVVLAYRPDGQLRTWGLMAGGTALLLTGVSVFAFFAATLRFMTPHAWVRRLKLIPFLFLLNAGLSWSQTIGMWRGVRGAPVAIPRTPKYGSAPGMVGGRRISECGYRLPTDAALGEGFAGIAVWGAAAVLALLNNALAPAVLTAVLGLGACFVSALATRQSLRHVSPASRGREWPSSR